MDEEHEVIRLIEWGFPEDLARDLIRVEEENKLFLEQERCVCGMQKYGMI